MLFLGSALLEGCLSRIKKDKGAGMNLDSMSVIDKENMSLTIGGRLRTNRHSSKVP